MSDTPPTKPPELPSEKPPEPDWFTYLPKNTVYARFVFPKDVSEYYETAEATGEGWVFEQWLGKQLVRQVKHQTKRQALSLIGKGAQLAEFQ